MEVVSINFVGTNVRSPVSSHTLDGALRYFNNEPAAPFVELKRDQIHSLFERTSEMWERAREPTLAEAWDYDFLQRRDHDNSIRHMKGPTFELTRRREFNQALPDESS